MNTNSNGDKGQKLFRLRDILFLLALLVNNGWIMFLAFVGVLASVIVQLRDDWKKYRKFDMFTVIYVALILAIASLLTYSLIAPIINGPTLASADAFRVLSAWCRSS